MSTLAEYSAWKAKQQQAGVGAASVVLGATADVKPDEVAGDLNLANEFGKVTGGPVPPLPMVTEHRSLFQQKIEEQKNQTILSGSPRLADWVRNPENAALARDDLEGLAQFERVADRLPFLGKGPTATGQATGEQPGAIGSAWDRGAARIPQAYNQFMADSAAKRMHDENRSFLEILDDETTVRNRHGEVMFKSVIPNPLDVLNAASRYATSALGKFAGDNEAAARFYQQEVGRVAKEIQAMPMSEGAARFRDQVFGDANRAKTPERQRYERQLMAWDGAGDGPIEPEEPGGLDKLWLDTSDFFQKFAADPAGALAFLGETAVESAPMLAATAAVGLATRNPTAAATFMGASSGLQERYLEPAQFFQSKGIDIATPEGAQAVIGNPELMREAANRGILRGTIIGSLDGLSGGVAGKMLAESPVGNMVLQALTQSLMGGGGEALAQFATDGKVDMREVIVEALAEFVTAPIDVATMTGSKIMRDRRRARDAEARTTLFQELSGQAVSSKLRERMPDRFRQFVEAATKDGPIENVYVPAKDFVEYFQGIGIDPFALVETLDGVTRDDLDAALAGAGDDLRIPTATYAARIAGSEHDAFLMENMRFDPDQMTAREAREANERLQDAMNEMRFEADQLRQKEELERPYREQIYDTVVSNMRAAGQATDVSTAGATLYPAFYERMAEWSGDTLEGFTGQYPLPRIEGERPEGMQLKNVDEFSRTLAKVRSRRGRKADTRQTLLEWISEHGGINDPGGELRARDAEVIKRGKGKKTLKLSRGKMDNVRGLFGRGDGKRFGMDDVAYAAIEAGFMADHPAVLEYKAAMERGDQVPDITGALLDAIDAELGGEAQYSRDQVRDERVDEDEWMDKVEDYLGRLGVSIDDDDAAIKAAIEAEETGRQYAQVSPEQARLIDMPVEMPSDPLFAEAVENTPGAKITEDGLLIDLVRFQKPEQEGATSVRTGVFYLPVGSSNARHYKTGGQPGQWYGGPVRVQGETLLRRPLFVKGATGGKAPEAALDAVRGKGAMKALERDIMHAIGARSALGRDADLFVEVIDELLNKHGSDGSMAWEIIENSKLGNQLRYALQENIVAHAVREAGYDSVIGHSKSKGKATISEVFDVREIDYPTPGQKAVLHPDVPMRRPPLFQRDVPATDTPAFREWFGDSKVVDDQGKPLVVYHGTNAVFDAFNTGRSEMGSHFGSEQQASAFPGAVGSYYLALKNPLRLQDYGQWDPANVVAAASDLGLIDAALVDDILDMPSAEAIAAAQAVIKNAGYDGIIYLNRREGLEVSEDDQGSFDMEASDDEFLAQYPQAQDSYIAFDPTQIKSVNNRGTFDPADPRILYQGDQGPRGSIQFPGAGIGNGDTIIRLFQRANLSTFLHETGHYFLTVMQDMARRGTPVAVQEFETINAWWGRNAAAVAADGNRAMPDANLTAADVTAALMNGTTGDTIKDAAIDVGMQEQWARAFEAYLMEGKAPSVELRSAFEKFRSWLISVYRNLAGLNVEVSPEIRGVFDRMLASDAQIAEAQMDVGGAQNLFATAEQMGLTDEQFARFLILRTQAEDEAKARLLGEAMAPIKRERDKWYKEEKAKVREEVAREVNAYRMYRAYEWLGNGRWIGDDEPIYLEPVKLSRKILVERYGEGVLKTLSAGRKPVYSVEGGVDPDDVAGWFGFSSGDEMVRAIEQAPRRADAINAETEKVMRDRHGDPLNDGAIEGMALDAVHNDKRGQWIAAELQAVSDVAGVDVALTAKQARHSARQTLNRMRVRDATAAQRYLAAERKAGEEAARLGAMLAREGVWMQNARRRVQTQARAAVRGDASPDAVAPKIERANASTENYNETVGRLLDAKRRQLLNHALYMESRKIGEEVEKAERLVARLNKKSTREKIAGGRRLGNADQVDYLSAIDEILDRYDFRKMSGRAEDKRGSLLAFVEAMKAAGRENELAIPDDVLTKAARAPYKTIPVEELRGVVDTLKNIEHMATLRAKLLDAQRERDLDATAEAITEAFDKNVRKRPPGAVGSRSEDWRNMGRKFLDVVLNAGTLLREIDGFADLGAAYTNIKSPIDDAMSRLITRKASASTDIEALYSVYSKAERRRMSVREHVPELGISLSKWERIAIALNTGNEGNRERLVSQRTRRKFTDQQIDAVLATLDERDADFVQSVWDYIGSFQPDLAARERRVTGTEPKWVEPSPVTIAGKTLRGGYYPIKYDPRLSTGARDRETQDIAQAIQSGRFGKAQTKNGHTKERSGADGDLELDMSVMHRHVNSVIYDLELSEPVSNSWRILHDSRVRGAFEEAGKSADFEALEIWLKDVAEGEVRSADVVGRVARGAKTNFTAAKLAFNLSTVAIQVTGLAQTMVVVGKRDFALGVQASFRPGVNADIIAKSPFMSTRSTTFHKDIYDMFEDPKLGPVAGRWAEFRNTVAGQLGFWLMTKVQWYLVDVPTWLAGYQQGLRKFANDEAKAVAHADGIVKRAQASGLFSDRSAIERGSTSNKTRQNDVVRLFTTLGSYMFAKFNVAYERSAVAARTMSEEGVSIRSAQEALSWTLDMAFLFTLEAVLYAAIKGKLPDDDDEDDDWMTFLAKETAFSVMSTIPGVRDVGSTLSGFEGGGAYGGITKEIAEPWKQMGQGEVDKTLVKSIISATGLATGAPTTAINRVVDAGWRQAEGDDVSPLEYLLGRIGKK